MLLHRVRLVGVVALGRLVAVVTRGEVGGSGRVGGVVTQGEVGGGCCYAG